MKKDIKIFHDSWTAHLPGRRDTVGSGGTIPGRAGMYDEIEAVSVESLDVTPMLAREVDDFHE